MEELKKEQPEEVIEQRPSTKYGRTAYQEELRKAQEANGSAAYEQTASFGQGATGAYGQDMNNQSRPWENQAYTPYTETKREVKPVLARVLMVLMAVSAIINCIVSMMTIDLFAELQTIDPMVVIDVLVESNEFALLSTIGDFIFWVTIVVFVFDIMALRRAEYKTVGAILFAIFLRPAYFIWRAHLLGEKKLAGIIYAACYYGFCMIEYVIIFKKAFDLVFILGY